MTLDEKDIVSTKRSEENESQLSQRSRAKTLRGRSTSHPSEVYEDYGGEATSLSGSVDAYEMRRSDGKDFGFRRFMIFSVCFREGRRETV